MSNRAAAGRIPALNGVEVLRQGGRVADGGCGYGASTIILATEYPPYANDDVADDLTPVGRVFYSASTLICTPASLSQEVGAALGRPSRRIPPP